MAKKNGSEGALQFKSAPTRATACALQFKEMILEKPPGTIARVEMLEVLSELSRLDVDELVTIVTTLKAEVELMKASLKENNTDGQENQA
ncbi:hypothetical protein LCGC14_1957050 [marine sediment metagenome]|uniref:Uncharacterized protein n=1 Tax=marine sediment metagenome TaxID=412755 RepID=A0A0F9FFP0_9ZZZZ